MYSIFTLNIGYMNQPYALYMLAAEKECELVLSTVVSNFFFSLLFSLHVQSTFRTLNLSVLILVCYT